MYYLTHSWVVSTFSKGIRPKVNVIAELEFELAYYNVPIKHVSHYAQETPHSTDV